MAWADVALFDWIAVGTFAFCTIVYHVVYYLISERAPMKTVRGKIHRYRRDWVEGVIKTRNYIMAVQAVRNLIMTTTFLASSMLLVMAFIFNYIITGRLEEQVQGNQTGDPLFRIEHGELFGFKVYLLLGLFAFAFFSFLLAIRLLNQFSVLIGVSPELIAQVEGLDPADYLAHILNKAASRHTYGLRAAYFAIPAGAWLFSTEAFLALTLGIWSMLVFVLDTRNVTKGDMVRGSMPPAQQAAGSGAGPPTSSASSGANPPPKTG
jgi:uncharacterized membrane protein